MAWATVSIFGLIFLIGFVSAAKHPKILGGEDAEIQLHPYQVSLRYNKKHFCSGAIISKTHILTAAHCVTHVDKNELTVHSGTSKSDGRGKVHRVRSVQVHPEWDQNKEKRFPNDIAVLTLKHPIRFDAYQQKVHLPNQDIQNLQKAYVSGWGSTSNGINRASQNLRQLRVEVITGDKCNSLLGYEIGEKQMCAFRSFGTGICRGDDGAPLVSNGKLIGIVSFMDSDTCGAGKPDIYTNVFAYNEFIESAMDQ